MAPGLAGPLGKGRAVHTDARVGCSRGQQLQGRGRARRRSDLLLDQRTQLEKLTCFEHAGIPQVQEHICFFLKVLVRLIKDITSARKLCHP